MNTAKRLNIVRESQAYWRIIINNPPLNLFDPWMFAELNVLMDDIEKDKDLKVVVFESGDEEFFMNHHDVVSRTIIPTCRVPPRFLITGLRLLRVWCSLPLSA